MTPRRWRPVLLLAGLVLLAMLPLLDVSLPGVLPGPTSAAGAGPYRFAFLNLPVMTLSYSQFHDDDVFLQEHFCLLRDATLERVTCNGCTIPTVLASRR